MASRASSQTPSGARSAATLEEDLRISMRERIVAPPVCTVHWTEEQIEKHCFRKIVEPEELALFGIKFRSTGKRDESGTLVYLADLNTPTNNPNT